MINPPLMLHGGFEYRLA